MKTVLSIDVAKNKSMIMLMDSEGEILIDSKEIKHNLEEFEKVKKEIEEINPENLTVFMESTGIYHLPVERYFKVNGFNTLVINSLKTKNNYDTIRKTKTDKKECNRLAKLFFVKEVEYHDLSKTFDFIIDKTLKETINNYPEIKTDNFVIIPLYHPVAQIRKQEQLEQYKRIWKYIN